MEIRGSVLFVDLLAVDSRYQNRQWGTELMKRAERYARRRGCEVSHLFVDEANVRGIRFYQRNGYQVVSHAKALKAYHMRKPLA